MLSNVIQFIFLAAIIGFSQAVKFSCKFAKSAANTPVVGSVWQCDTTVSYFRSETTVLEAVDGYQSESYIFFVEHSSSSSSTSFDCPRKLEFCSAKNRQFHAEHPKPNVQEWKSEINLGRRSSTVPAA